jgi:hypothetical protein
MTELSKLNDTLAMYYTLHPEARRLFKEAIHGMVRPPKTPPNPVGRPRRLSLSQRRKIAASHRQFWAKMSPVDRKLEVSRRMNSR